GPSAARNSMISSIGVSCRSRSASGSFSTRSAAYLRGSGERKRAPARPPNSIASAPGSMIRPRRMIGMSIAFMSAPTHVVHEVLICLGRARARDLVVAALHLREAHDLALDVRRTKAAGAVAVPVHRDAVARDESAPVGLGEQIVEGEPPRLHPLARQRDGILVE